MAESNNFKHNLFKRLALLDWFIIIALVITAYKFIRSYGFGAGMFNLITVVFILLLIVVIIVQAWRASGRIQRTTQPQRLFRKYQLSWYYLISAFITILFFIFPKSILWLFERLDYLDSRYVGTFLVLFIFIYLAEWDKAKRKAIKNGSKESIKFLSGKFAVKALLVILLTITLLFGAAMFFANSIAF